jgi:hypothetical protein
MPVNRIRLIAITSSISKQQSSDKIKNRKKVTEATLFAYNCSPHKRLQAKNIGVIARTLFFDVADPEGAANLLR